MTRPLYNTSCVRGFVGFHNLQDLSLECHFDTTVAVCVTLTQSGATGCVISASDFSQVVYNGKLHIWICRSLICQFFLSGCIPLIQ